LAFQPQSDTATDGTPDQPTFERLIGSIRRSGCAEPLEKVDARVFASRTLPDLAADVATFDILTVTPQRCPFR
jgi:hypothetical protein